MTEHFRSNPDQETAMGRFLRGRWQYGSVYVLDIDHLICDPYARFGVLIEEKHVSANDRTASVTKRIAKRLGWWAALFVYCTDDGTPKGEVTQIDATFWNPHGRESHVDHMDVLSFNLWVCEQFGARQKVSA